MKLYYKKSFGSEFVLAHVVSPIANFQMGKYVTLQLISTTVSSVNVRILFWISYVDRMGSVNIC